MRNIHFKTCTCLLGILLMLFSGIQARGASLEVQQERKISGTVIDEKGEPVIGASVVVVETKQGTITNIDGKFQVNAPQNGRLKISYIGYETQEVAIKDRQLLKIVLKEESTALNEVVVVGYGTMKRKEMTSAISHVGAKDLNQISSLDASMLLQGKVSSVSVSNTALADPNSTGSIQIRGISSRNAGLGPLIVVDGVPGGDMTNINPADIESIDVLKDGAASAIYGTRGSNGVILVNLKKGTRDGEVHTTYSAAVTFNKAKKELDIMNAEEYRAYRTVSNPLSDMGASTDWFDAIYRNLYFIPMDEHGIRQLRLMTVPDWKERLLELLFDPEVRTYDRGLFEYDAKIDDAYVFSHLDGDLARLVRFKEAVENQCGNYEVLCYPYQMAFIREYLGSRVTIKTIGFDAVEAELDPERRNLFER